MRKRQRRFLFIEEDIPLLQSQIKIISRNKLVNLVHCK